MLALVEPLRTPIPGAPMTYCCPARHVGDDSPALLPLHGARRAPISRRRSGRAVKQAVKTLLGADVGSRSRARCDVIAAGRGMKLDDERPSLYRRRRWSRRRGGDRPCSSCARCVPALKRRAPSSAVDSAVRAVATSSRSYAGSSVEPFPQALEHPPPAEIEPRRSTPDARLPGRAGSPRTSAEDDSTCGAPAWSARRR